MSICCHFCFVVILLSPGPGTGPGPVNTLVVLRARVLSELNGPVIKSEPPFNLSSEFL